MIKKFLPQTLLGRSVLILVVPLIVLELIITIIFYNRHWDTITRHRTIDFVQDITLIVESFERNKSIENQKWSLNNVKYSFACSYVGIKGTRLSKKFTTDSAASCCSLPLANLI